MINKYVFNTIIGLGMTHMLIADEEPDMVCCPSVIVGEPIDPCCINPVYPYPANYDPCNGWNIYAKGEFLYLSSIIDTHQNPAGHATFDKSEIEWGFQKTPYRPGFRVALGFDLGSVVLDLTYLRYHPHTTSHFSARDNGAIILTSANPGLLAPAFGQPQAFFQDVTTTMHIFLDMGLISLQRPVYMGKKIIMNLNYGIMALWAGEKWHITATALNNPIPPQVGFTSNGVTTSLHKSWAVGPNLGFTGTALFPCHFQVYGNIDLSLQYAVAYKTDSSSTFPNYPFPLGNNILRQRGDAAHIQAWHSGELGIGWGDYLFCDRYHVNLSVGYNWLFQHIFAYNPAFNPSGVDLLFYTSFSVHGIGVSARLDF